MVGQLAWARKLKLKSRTLLAMGGLNGARTYTLPVALRVRRALARFKRVPVNVEGRAVPVAGYGARTSVTRRTLYLGKG